MKATKQIEAIGAIDKGKTAGKTEVSGRLKMLAEEARIRVMEASLMKERRRSGIHVNWSDALRLRDCIDEILKDSHTPMLKHVESDTALLCGNGNEEKQPSLHDALVDAKQYLTSLSMRWALAERRIGC